MNHSAKLIYLGILFFSFLFIPNTSTMAHCDGIDGPVVKAAQKALDTKNVNLVLIWVQKNYENDIKDAFQKTLRVRSLNKEAQELADLYFFETLVRIHRAGEGEAYSGLKPAGRDLGPVIPAADRSIDEGSIQNLRRVFEAKKLSTSKIEKLFNEVMKNKNYSANNVEAGRNYVHAYVEFLHTAETLYTNKQIQHRHNN